MGTYTAILASDPDLLICSHHLNMLSKWCHMWKIKVNELKSTHITSPLRPKDCPEVLFNNTLIHYSREAKYLGLLFDRRLAWVLISKVKGNNSTLAYTSSDLSSNKI